LKLLEKNDKSIYNITILEKGVSVKTKEKWRDRNGYKRKEYMGII